jgi:hypothetical protein
MPPTSGATIAGNDTRRRSTNGTQPAIPASTESTVIGLPSGDSAASITSTGGSKTTGS